MDAIIVENRCKELFATIPALTFTPSGGTEQSFSSKYDFGTYKQLLRFLDDKLKQSKSAYPLIWLQTPITTTGRRKVRLPLKLVFAIDTKMTLSNSERLETTFKYGLNPLVEYALHGLQSSNISEIVDIEAMKRSNIFNFTEVKPRDNKKGTEQKSIDIWDAVVVELECEFNNKVLKPCIYYG